MRARTLLLVEDDPDEALLARAAFARAGLHDLVIVSDGESAVAHLVEHPKATPLPALVLLDLKLPGIDGFEVLRRIRADAATSLVPIVVFTSSVEERDVVTSYRLGANSYVRKPIDFDQMMALATEIVRYWLAINTTAEEPAVT